MQARTQIRHHYDSVLSAYDLFSRERLISLRESLHRVQIDFDSDEVLLALNEDPTTSNYAYLRMREVADNMLVTDTERSLHDLRLETIVLKEQIVKLRNTND